jgi:hypothetical protein
VDETKGQRLNHIHGDRHRRQAAAIAKIADYEPAFKHVGFIESLERYDAFTPRQALAIIERFNRYGIYYHPEDFRINTKEKRFRYQLKEFTGEEMGLLFPAFSDYQRSDVRVIGYLRTLHQKLDKFDAEGNINFYLDSDAFTPKMISYIFYLMDKNEVAYNKKHFRLYIRRKKDYEQLQEMEDWKVKKIWPAMSYEQKRKYNEEIATKPIPLNYE